MISIYYKIVKNLSRTAVIKLVSKIVPQIYLQLRALKLLVPLSLSA
jgi:hypothetical protein